jgi:sugar phosphate isomerase/epimerase
MKTRREFIKTAALVTAGALAVKAYPLPLPKKKLVGLQLWTLRDTIETETVKTLEKVSMIGYNSIEPYGFDGSFYGIPAVEFRKLIEGLGMRLTSTHTGIDLENSSKYINAALEAGLEYLVLPSPGGRQVKTADDVKRLAEEMNLIGDKASKAGIRFGYHNHAAEFNDTGEGIGYDILLKNTDPELVCFQLDIFWIIKAGKDPLDYFEKYPSRFELWHVKDLDQAGESTVIGSGTIDYEKIFSKARLSGMKRFYVEQESYAVPPIEAIEGSYQYIKDNLL